jgi:uncharacterized membrane-anchored protein YhcB (DUF1043 family)
MVYRSLAALLLVLLTLPRIGLAELFERAQQATTTVTSRADSSGYSLRGGVHLQTGSPAGSSSLFRASVTTGNTCGGFDFRASLQELFEEMPDIFEALFFNIIQQVPMLALCYGAPTLCQLGEHWQALLNAALQAKYAQCHAIQQAMAYGGLRLRGGAASQCLEDATNSGMTINQAMRECESSVPSLRLPGGGRGGTINVVRDTLDAAGASAETQALASSLVGDMTLRVGNGGLSAQGERPSGAMLARYEQHRQDAEQRFRDAIDEYNSTGTLSDQTVQQISIPGQALPRAAIEALSNLSRAPMQQQSHIGKLSTGQAIVRLTWECHEIQAQLQAAADGNQHITDEVRRQLETRYAAMQVQLTQVVQKVTMVEQHYQPALDALLRDYTQTQLAASDAGLRTPTVTVAPTRYRGQQPMGYSR